MTEKLLHQIRETYVRASIAFDLAFKEARKQARREERKTVTKIRGFHDQYVTIEDTSHLNKGKPQLAVGSSRSISVTALSLRQVKKLIVELNKWVQEHENES